MHINKFFRCTSQLNLNIFLKLYYFHNAVHEMVFICSVELIRELYRSISKDHAPFLTLLPFASTHNQPSVYLL